MIEFINGASQLFLWLEDVMNDQQAAQLWQGESIKHFQEKWMECQGKPHVFWQRLDVNTRTMLMEEYSKILKDV